METSESYDDHFHLHRTWAHVDHKFCHSAAWGSDNDPDVSVFSASEGTLWDEFPSSCCIVGFKHNSCRGGFSSSCIVDYERAVQGVLDGRHWRVLGLDGVLVGMEQRDISVPVSCPSSLLAAVHPCIAAPMQPIGIEDEAGVAYGL
jgi:hypothetical protein